MEIILLLLLIKILFTKNGQVTAVNISTAQTDPSFRLRRTLFANYYKDMIAKKPYTTLNISLAFYLDSIDLDDIKETMTILGGLDMYWTDYRLTWDPSDYDGIDWLAQPQQSIWLPDLILTNNADTKSSSIFQLPFLLAGINSNGLIETYPIFTLTSTCGLDLKYFPFDKRKCEIRFGSQFFSPDDLILTLTNYGSSVLMGSYSENAVWTLLNTKIEVDLHQIDDYFVSQVVITLNLQRRTMYYAFNFIYPCFITCFLCIMGFYLPSESGEKLTLEITNVLSTMVFTQLISTITPASSSGIPVICVYFTSVSFLCTFSVAANVFILRLNHKEVKLGQKMPKWFQRLVCNYLARILLLKPLDKIIPNKETSMKKKKEENKQPLEILDLDKSANQNRNSEKSDQLKTLISEISKYLRFFHDYLKDAENDENEILKWKYAVIVMDRLFLIITSVYSVVAFVSIIMPNPGFYFFK